MPPRYRSEEDLWLLTSAWAARLPAEWAARDLSLKIRAESRGLLEICASDELIQALGEISGTVDLRTRMLLMMMQPDLLCARMPSEDVVQALCRCYTQHLAEDWNGEGGREEAEEEVVPELGLGHHVRNGPEYAMLLIEGMVALISSTLISTLGRYTPKFAFDFRSCSLGADEVIHTANFVVNALIRCPQLIEACLQCESRYLVPMSIRVVDLIHALRISCHLPSVRSVIAAFRDQLSDDAMPFPDLTDSISSFIARVSINVRPKYVGMLHCFPSHVQVLVQKLHDFDVDMLIRLVAEADRLMKLLGNTDGHCADEQLSALCISFLQSNQLAHRIKSCDVLAQHASALETKHADAADAPYSIFLEMLERGGIIDIVMGERFHVEVVRRSTPILLAIVRAGKWSSDDTGRLVSHYMQYFFARATRHPQVHFILQFFLALQRHSTEQREIAVLIDQLLKTNPATPSPIAVSDSNTIQLTSSSSSCLVADILTAIEAAFLPPAAQSPKCAEMSTVFSRCLSFAPGNPSFEPSDNTYKFLLQILSALINVIPAPSDASAELWRDVIGLLWKLVRNTAKPFAKSDLQLADGFTPHMWRAATYCPLSFPAGDFCDRIESLLRGAAKEARSSGVPDCWLIGAESEEADGFTFHTLLYYLVDLIIEDLDVVTLFAGSRTLLMLARLEQSYDSMHLSSDGRTVCTKPFVSGFSLATRRRRLLHYTMHDLLFRALETGPVSTANEMQEWYHAVRDAVSSSISLHAAHNLLDVLLILRAVLARNVGLLTSSNDTQETQPDNYTTADHVSETGFEPFSDARCDFLVESHLANPNYSMQPVDSAVARHIRCCAPFRAATEETAPSPCMFGLCPFHILSLLHISSNQRAVHAALMTLLHDGASWRLHTSLDSSSLQSYRDLQMSDVAGEVGLIPTGDCRFIPGVSFGVDTHTLSSVVLSTDPAMPTWLWWTLIRHMRCLPPGMMVQQCWPAMRAAWVRFNCVASDGVMAEVNIVDAVDGRVQSSAPIQSVVATTIVPQQSAPLSAISSQIYSFSHLRGLDALLGWLLASCGDVVAEGVVDLLSSLPLFAARSALSPMQIFDDIQSSLFRLLRAVDGSLNLADQPRLIANETAIGSTTQKLRACTSILMCIYACRRAMLHHLVAMVPGIGGIPRAEWQNLQEILRPHMVEATSQPVTVHIHSAMADISRVAPGWATRSLLQSKDESEIAAIVARNQAALHQCISLEKGGYSISCPSHALVSDLSCRLRLLEPAVFPDGVTILPAREDPAGRPFMRDHEDGKILFRLDKPATWLNADEICSGKIGISKSVLPQPIDHLPSQTLWGYQPFLPIVCTTIPFQNRYLQDPSVPRSPAFSMSQLEALASLPWVAIALRPAPALQSLDAERETNTDNRDDVIHASDAADRGQLYIPLVAQAFTLMSLAEGRQEVVDAAIAAWIVITEAFPTLQLLTTSLRDPKTVPWAAILMKRDPSSVGELWAPFCSSSLGAAYVLQCLPRIILELDECTLQAWTQDLVMAGAIECIIELIGTTGESIGTRPATFQEGSAELLLLAAVRALWLIMLRTQHLVGMEHIWDVQTDVQDQFIYTLVVSLIPHSSRGTVTPVAGFKRSRKSYESSHASSEPDVGARLSTWLQDIFTAGTSRIGKDCLDLLSFIVQKAGRAGNIALLLQHSLTEASLISLLQASEEKGVDCTKALLRIIGDAAASSSGLTCILISACTACAEQLIPRIRELKVGSAWGLVVPPVWVEALRILDGILKLGGLDTSVGAQAAAMLSSLMRVMVAGVRALAEWQQELSTPLPPKALPTSDLIAVRLSDMPSVQFLVLELSAKLAISIIACSPGPFTFGPSGTEFIAMSTRYLCAPRPVDLVPPIEHECNCQSALWELLTTVLRHAGGKQSAWRLDVWRHLRARLPFSVSLPLVPRASGCNDQDLFCLTENDSLALRDLSSYLRHDSSLLLPKYLKPLRNYTTLAAGALQPLVTRLVNAARDCELSMTQYSSHAVELPASMADVYPEEVCQLIADRRTSLRLLFGALTGFDDTHISSLTGEVSRAVIVTLFQAVVTGMDKIATSEFHRDEVPLKTFGLHSTEPADAFESMKVHCRQLLVILTERLLLCLLCGDINKVLRLFAPHARCSTLFYELAGQACLNVPDIAEHVLRAVRALLHQPTFPPGSTAELREWILTKLDITAVCLAANLKPGSAIPPKQLFAAGSSPYAGLVNQGATCYMNSLLQQLFMMPLFRHLVLAHQLTEDRRTQVAKHELCDKIMGLRFEFQRVFVELLYHRHVAVDPLSFVEACDDSALMPLEAPAMQQNDASEFFTYLADRLGVAMGTGILPSSATDSGHDVFTACFGGKLLHQIRGKTECLHCKQREEAFITVPLEVRNHRTLESSLRAFVEEELLSGDNAYSCEDCGKKVDSSKRVCFGSQLPHTLLFALKRFTINYETFQREKINDELRFPMELDMLPYTADGVELDAGTARPPQKYRLAGVVVHSGSSYGGHYYSCVRSRNGDTNPGRGSGLLEVARLANAMKQDQLKFSDDFVGALGDLTDTLSHFQISLPENVSPQAADEQWFVFNDDHVEVIQKGLDDFARDCWFGGLISGRARVTSAYMLVYEKIIEPPTVLETPVAPNAVVLPAALNPLSDDTRRHGERVDLALSPHTGELLAFLLEDATGFTPVNVREMHEASCKLLLDVYFHAAANDTSPQLYEDGNAASSTGRLCNNIVLLWKGLNVDGVLDPLDLCQDFVKLVTFPSPVSPQDSVLESIARESSLLFLYFGNDDPCFNTCRSTSSRLLIECCHILGSIVNLDYQQLDWSDLETLLSCVNTQLHQDGTGRRTRAFSLLNDIALALLRCVPLAIAMSTQDTDQVWRRDPCSCIMDIFAIALEEPNFRICLWKNNALECFLNVLSAVYPISSAQLASCALTGLENFRAPLETNSLRKRVANEKDPSYQSILGSLLHISACIVRLYRFADYTGAEFPPHEGILKWTLSGPLLTSDSRCADTGQVNLLPAGQSVLEMLVGPGGLLACLMQTATQVSSLPVLLPALALVRHLCFRLPNTTQVTLLTVARLMWYHDTETPSFRPIDQHSVAQLVLKELVFHPSLHDDLLDLRLYCILWFLTPTNLASPFLVLSIGSTGFLDGEACLPAELVDALKEYGHLAWYHTSSTVSGTASGEPSTVRRFGLLSRILDVTVGICEASELSNVFMPSPDESVIGWQNSIQLPTRQSRFSVGQAYDMLAVLLSSLHHAFSMAGEVDAAAIDLAMGMPTGIDHLPTLLHVLQFCADRCSENLRHHWTTNKMKEEWNQVYTAAVTLLEQIRPQPDMSRQYVPRRWWPASVPPHVHEEFDRRVEEAALSGLIGDAISNAGDLAAVTFQNVQPLLDSAKQVCPVKRLLLSAAETADAVLQIVPNLAVFAKLSELSWLTLLAVRPSNEVLYLPLQEITPAIVLSHLYGVCASLHPDQYPPMAIEQQFGSSIISSMASHAYVMLQEPPINQLQPSRGQDAHVCTLAASICNVDVQSDLERLRGSPITPGLAVRVGALLLWLHIQATMNASVELMDVESVECLEDSSPEPVEEHAMDAFKGDV